MPRKQTPKPKQSDASRAMGFKESTYQPSKAELEEEFDMPGLSKEGLRVVLAPSAISHAKFVAPTVVFNKKSSKKKKKR